MKHASKFLAAAAAALLMCVPCACGADTEVETKDYSFSLDTGDLVTLSLDISDDYDMYADETFEIYKEGVMVMSGMFISEDAYHAYVDSVENDSDATVLETGERDDVEYMMWNYADIEYDYVMLIKDASSGILLGSNDSEKEARECFSRLKVILDD